MKYILFSLTILLLIACNESKQRTIKTCKVYSSDFVLLDDESPGIIIQEFQFNDAGQVSKLIRYGNDGEITSTFDINGEESPFPLAIHSEFTDTTISHTDYGTMGDVRKTEVMEYNEAGYLQEIRLYNSIDSLKQKNTYKYNEEGYIQKDIYWDVELDAPMQVINYEYEYNDNK